MFRCIEAFYNPYRLTDAFFTGGTAQGEVKTAKINCFGLDSIRSSILIFIQNLWRETILRVRNQERDGNTTPVNVDIIVVFSNLTTSNLVRDVSK